MVSLKVNFQKKDLWLVAAIMVFIAGVGYVIASYSQPIPNPGHGGDNVYININGNNTDLQTAINDSDFNSCSISGTSFSGNIIHGHRGEEIIVNVNGSIKSLQQAINDSSLVNAEANSSPSNFGTGYYGNNGDKIWIKINGSEKTLQQAINNGSFKCSGGGCSTGNLALGGTPAYTYWGSHMTLQCTLGECCCNSSDINDNNENTFVGVGGDNWFPPVQVNYEAKVNFNEPAEINRVEYVREAIRSPDGDEVTSLLINGSWIEVHRRSGLGGKSTEVFNGNWQNVTGVKMTIGFLGDTTNRNYHRLYELRAFGSSC